MPLWWQSQLVLLSLVLWYTGVVIASVSNANGPTQYTTAQWPTYPCTPLCWMAQVDSNTHMRQVSKSYFRQVTVWQVGWFIKSLVESLPMCNLYEMPVRLRSCLCEHYFWLNAFWILHDVCRNTIIHSVPSEHIPQTSHFAVNAGIYKSSNTMQCYPVEHHCSQRQTCLIQRHPNVASSWHWSIICFPIPGVPPTECCHKWISQWNDQVL